MIIGVFFDQTFSFVRHVDFTVTKPNSMFGFMMRICATVFKSIYFLLVA